MTKGLRQRLAPSLIDAADVAIEFATLGGYGLEYATAGPSGCGRTESPAGATRAGHPPTPDWGFGWEAPRRTGRGACEVDTLDRGRCAPLVSSRRR